MAYFDGIKVGDKVYDVILGWGIVKDIVEMKSGLKLIKVYFEDNCIFNYYTFDGRPYAYKNSNQALFWDEIKPEIPQKSEIKLKENEFLICLHDNEVDNDEEFINARIGDYTNENGLLRDDEKTAKKALKAIRRFTRLLALRDQECINSRGYEFKYACPNYTIYKNHSYSIPKYEVRDDTYAEEFTVYFKTEKDAQRICNILNERKFDLEGE